MLFTGLYGLFTFWGGRVEGKGRVQGSGFRHVARHGDCTSDET